MFRPVAPVPEKYVSGGHGWHSVLPVPETYFPDSHGVHDVFPVKDLYVPAGQSSQSDALVGVSVPFFGWVPAPH